MAKRKRVDHHGRELSPREVTEWLRKDQKRIAAVYKANGLPPPSFKRPPKPKTAIIEVDDGISIYRRYVGGAKPPRLHPEDRSIGPGKEFDPGLEQIRQLALKVRRDIATKVETLIRARDVIEVDGTKLPRVFGRPTDDELAQLPIVDQMMYHDAELAIISVDDLRAAIRANNIIEAAFRGFTVGHYYHSLMVRPSGPNALEGRRTIKRRRKGTDATVAKFAAKRPDNRTLRTERDKLIREGCKKGAADKRLAMRYGCEPSTIRRWLSTAKKISAQG
ncbi:MAG TPA: hypothetical protein VG713_12390 [Pirellulales bacterium]|nr:hypothetical protein [Pirellulales bacterium]